MVNTEFLSRPDRSEFVPITDTRLVEFKPEYPKQKEDKPPWLEALLDGSKNQQTVLQVRDRAYFIDYTEASDGQDGHRFLTLYDPVTQSVLVKADFEIFVDESSGERSLRLLDGSVRCDEKYANSFKEHRQFLRKKYRYYDRGFDWLTTSVEEGRHYPREQEDIRCAIDPFLIVLGQIARDERVTAIYKESVGNRHLYDPTGFNRSSWHTNFVNTIIQSALAPSPEMIAVLASESPKKAVLAQNQQKIFIIQRKKADVAEASSSGGVEGLDLYKKFLKEASHPNVLSFSEWLEHVRVTAEQKALGGLIFDSAVPVVSSDTTGGVVIDAGGSPIQNFSLDQLGKPDITTNILTLAKDTPVDVIKGLRGATVLVSCAQAIASHTLSHNSIPEVIVTRDASGSLVPSRDTAKLIIEAARKGQITSFSSVATVAVTISPEIPDELLVSSGGVSGLGIDLYPGGELDPNLEKYISVYRRNGDTWEKANLEDDKVKADKVKAIILGFSTDQFLDLSKNVYPNGYPFMVLDRVRGEEDESDESLIRLGRLRSIYTYVSRLLSPGSTLCDFGAWIGRYLHIPAIRANVTALDIDSESIQTATSNLEKFTLSNAHGVSVITKDVTDTDYPDDSFDTVTVLEILEYMKDSEDKFDRIVLSKALREAYRISKPHRTIRPAYRQPSVVVSTRIFGQNANLQEGETRGVYNEDSLLQALTNSGFKSENVYMTYQTARGDFINPVKNNDGIITDYNGAEFIIAMCYK